MVAVSGQTAAEYKHKVKLMFFFFIVKFPPQKNDSLASADSELAQCEAEVGTLLRILAELNVKMSALQIPR